MPEWASSAWLLAALLSVPLVRWLHRLGESGDPRRVSAAYLWPTMATAVVTGARSPRVDPVWRLRALIVALMCVAAAQPRFTGGGAAIQVWLDDSLSMQTVEADGKRFDLALAALQVALDEAEPASVLVRSLTQPERVLSTDVRTEGLSRWLESGSRTLLLPAPVQMAPSAEHWLVTDGADPRLAGWAASAPLARVIQVGRASENAALSQLAARLSPRDRDRLSALVRVVNLGGDPVERDLVLAHGDHLQRVRIAIPAGGEITHRFAVRRAAEGRLRAQMEPGDPLPADDGLSLDLSALAPLSVGVDAGCPPPVHAAAATHPRLALAERGEIEIACASARPRGSRPTLWLRSGVPAPAVAGLALWHPAAKDLAQLRIEGDWLRAIGVEDGEGRVLLALRGRPLVLEHTGPPALMETRIALDEGGLVRHPEFAALFAGLVDRLLGRPLLTEVVAVSRPPAGSRIAPRSLSVARRAAATGTDAGGVHLSPYCLAVAALCLMLDLLRLLMLQLRPRAPHLGSARPRAGG